MTVYILSPATCYFFIHRQISETDPQGLFSAGSACDVDLATRGRRLGSHDRELLPRVVESLLGRNITMVACGGAHTITLSSELTIILKNYSVFYLL